MTRVNGNILSLAVGALVFVGAILWALGRGSIKTPAVSSEVSARFPIVSVLTRSPQIHQPIISTFGTARAEFDVTLTAETSGIVRSVSQIAYSGAGARMGVELVKIDDTRQHALLAEARASLAQARVNLIDEKLQGEQALSDWKRSGAKGDPPVYVIREPQLESAKASLENAKEAAAEAEREVQRTSVRAPFNAIVVERLASPGTFVQPGTKLLRLFGSDRLEVRLALSKKDWRLLPPEKDLLASSWSVELESADGRDHWMAKVSRIEKHVVENTRQRALVAVLDNPLNHEVPLFPGTFVRASLRGVAREKMLRIPTSSVTDRGEIWFVEDGDVLEKRVIRQLHSQDGHFLIPAFRAEPVRLLIHPMLSYLPDMIVSPIEDQPNIPNSGNGN